MAIVVLAVQNVCFVTTMIVGTIICSALNIYLRYYKGKDVRVFI